MGVLLPKLAKMVSLLVGARVDASWWLFLQGRAAGHFWCNTAIKRNSFAIPWVLHGHFRGKSHVGVKSETRAGEPTGLLFTPPPPRSRVLPARRDVWAKADSDRLGSRGGHGDEAPGQGGRQVEHRKPRTGTLVAAMSGTPWRKPPSGSNPSGGWGAFRSPPFLGILQHSFSSLSKGGFFPRGSRAVEASLGHDAVQPEHVRDPDRKYCTLFTAGLYPL